MIQQDYLCVQESITSPAGSSVVSETSKVLPAVCEVLLCTNFTRSWLVYFIKYTRTLSYKVCDACALKRKSVPDAPFNNPGHRK